MAIPKLPANPALKLDNGPNTPGRAKFARPALLSGQGANIYKVSSKFGKPATPLGNVGPGSKAR